MPANRPDAVSAAGPGPAAERGKQVTQPRPSILKNRAASLLASLAALLWAGAATAKPEAVTVFAAASLTDALTDVGHLWQARGNKVTFVFDASSTLAQQIEHGAAADVFISADELWMDRLATLNRIRQDSRADLLGNSLVLIEPRAHLHPITLGPRADIAGILGADGRLAVGDPAAVPAGLYARQALTALGLWPALQNRLAPSASVRGALLLVARGEAPAGIVYATDARIDPHVGIAGTFPPNSHDPIRYPAAATATGNRVAAEDFLTFLHSPDAADVFQHYGFPPPGR